MRGLSHVAERLDALAARAVSVLFGPNPTLDGLAAFWLVEDLRPVLRRLTHLPDDELRGVLRRLCLHLLDRPASPPG